MVSAIERFHCMSRSYILPKLEFPGFWSVIHRPRQTWEIIFWLCVSIWVPTYGKNFIVIPFVFFKITGGCFHLPDAIRLSEKATAITSIICLKFSRVKHRLGTKLLSSDCLPLVRSDNISKASRSRHQFFLF